MRRAIEVTTNVGCRNLCEYCPQEVNIQAYKQRSALREMKFDDFKVCIDKIPIDVRVYFAGSSEPFLCKDAIKMIEYACSRGHEVHVYTTLIGLDKEKINSLRDMSVYKYVIHLPSEVLKENFSANEEYINILRCFDEVLFDDRATYERVRYMALKEVSSNVKKYFSRKIHEVPFEVMSDFGGNLKIGYVPHRFIKGKIFCNNDRLYWNVLYPNGDVALCCEDFGLKHILGNLKENDYEYIHNSEEFNRVVMGMLDDNIQTICRRCEYAQPIKEIIGVKRPANLKHLSNNENVLKIINAFGVAKSRITDSIRKRLKN